MIRRFIVRHSPPVISLIGGRLDDYRISQLDFDWDVTPGGTL